MTDPEPVKGHPGVGAMVACRCGCGERFAQYDDHGRERVYVKGHWLKSKLRESLDETAKGLEPFR